MIREVWRPQTYRYKEQVFLDSGVGRGHRDRLDWADVKELLPLVVVV